MQRDLAILRDENRTLRTPVRDVVDRCCVWESHADPAISKTRNPTPDPMYPTFAVGEIDSNNEITRVAAVTELK